MDRLAVAEARLAAALEALDGIVAAPAEAAALVARLQAENQALAAALETARADIEAYEARLADLARPGEGAPDADIRLAEMEALAEEAFGERDQARAENTRLSAELAALRNEGAALRGRLAAVEAQNNQRQADLFRLESVAETAVRKLDQSISRIDRAIAE